MLIVNATPPLNLRFDVLKAKCKWLLISKNNIFRNETKIIHWTSNKDYYYNYFCLKDYHSKYDNFIIYIIKQGVDESSWPMFTWSWNLWKTVGYQSVCKIPFFLFLAAYKFFVIKIKFSWHPVRSQFWLTRLFIFLQTIYCKDFVRWHIV